MQDLAKIIEVLKRFCQLFLKRNHQHLKKNISTCKEITRQQAGLLVSWSERLLQINTIFTETSNKICEKFAKQTFQDV
jgi:hypothetical protein